MSTHERYPYQTYPSCKMICHHKLPKSPTPININPIHLHPSQIVHKLKLMIIHATNKISLTHAKIKPPSPFPKPTPTPHEGKYF